MLTFVFAEIDSSEIFRRSRSPGASTEEDSGSQHEAEVVPVAAVVDFVEIHIVREEGDDEGEGGDDPVPQAKQEASGRLTFGR